MLQVGVLEARTCALSAAFAAAGVRDAGAIPDRARANFDEALAAGPVPEDEMARLRRELGV